MAGRISHIAAIRTARVLAVVAVMLLAALLASPVLTRPAPAAEIAPAPVSSTTSVFVAGTEAPIPDSLVGSAVAEEKVCGVSAYEIPDESVSLVSSDLEVAGIEFAVDDNAFSVGDGPSGTDAGSPSASPASEKAATGQPIDIVVIDTGCPEGGEGLAGWESALDGEAPPWDGHGHGTAMLEVMREAAPDAAIYSVKALGDDGKGSISAVARALERARELKPKVVSLSFSAVMPKGCFVIEDEIARMAEEGIIVVGAAGNGGIDASDTVPGRIAEAVIVGACHADGSRRPNSNFGDTVDLYADAGSTSIAAARYSAFLVSGGAVSPAFEGLLPFSQDMVAPKAKEPDGGEPGRVLYRIAFDPAGGIGRMDDLDVLSGGAELPASQFASLGGSEFCGWYAENDQGRIDIPDRQFLEGYSFTSYSDGSSVNNDLSPYIADGKLTLHAKWWTGQGEDSIDRPFAAAASPWWVVGLTGPYIILDKGNTNFAWSRPGAATANGTSVKLYNYVTDTANIYNTYYWNFSSLESGTNQYKIYCPTAPNQVLDIAGGTMVDDTDAELWNWGGGSNQKFWVDKNDNGSQTLISFLQDGTWVWFVGHFKTSTANSTNICLYGMTGQRNVDSSGNKYGSTNANLQVYITEARYKVKFNGNGSTGGSMPDQSIWVDHATALSPNSFTKTGHSFAGWATSSGGSVVHSNQKQVTNLSTVHNSTVNLYAKWNVNSYKQTVKVRYQNADGSWGAYSNAIDSNYSYGSTVSWSRSEDATYKAASISYATPDSAQTKYVDVYRKTATATVRYRLQNADGTYPASYTSGASGTKCVGGSASFTYAQTDTHQEKSGTATVNAAASASGTPADVTVSIDVPRKTADVTFRYRLQNADGTYPSTYAAGRTDAGVRVGQAVSYTTSADPSVYSNKTKSGTVAAAPSATAAPADVTVSIEVPRSSFPVVFDANGGTVSGAASSEATVARGNSITAPVPTREGHTLVCWVPVKADDGKWIEVLYQEPDTTYFADEAEARAKNAAGAYSCVGQMPKLRYGGVYEFLQTADEKPGEANRWRQSNDITRTTPAADAASAEGFEAVSLSWGAGSFKGLVNKSARGSAFAAYAAGESGYWWHAVGQYIPYLGGNPWIADGSFVATSPVHLYALSDASLSNLPADFDSGIGAGSAVHGKYEPQRFKALWRPDACTVSFDANDGSGEGADPEDVVYGQAAAAPGCARVVAGMAFAGWDTRPDGTGERFMPGDSLDALAAGADGGTVALYAQWELVAAPTGFEAGPALPRLLALAASLAAMAVLIRTASARRRARRTRRMLGRFGPAGKNHEKTEHGQSG